MNEFISAAIAADIAGASNRTIQSWIDKGFIKTKQTSSGALVSLTSLAEKSDLAKGMLNSRFCEETQITPMRPYTCVELFAGAGGLALGMEEAGFKTLALNEMDKHACNTLRHNRPHWNVLEGDIHKADFSPYAGKVDVLSGGFPCQAFSYAGSRKGFEDTRGTLFFEFARAIQSISPVRINIDKHVHTTNSQIGRAHV